MASPNPAPMYQIQQIPGKGRGLVARHNITRGERILSESPLFTFPNIEDTMPIRQIIGPKVQALNDDQRRTFFGLFNNFRYFGTTGSIGNIKTNVLRVDHDTDAVFATFSLINHSCLPNASYSWNGNIMKGTLHALRDISAGDEITIAYGDHRRGSAGRFVCLCPPCTSDDRAGLARSDRRREEMSTLEDKIWRWDGPPREPEDVFRLCEELQTLMLEEHNNSASPALAEVYELAAGIAAANSDAGRTVALSELAYLVRSICEGEDNPNTQQCAVIMEDARAHPRWGRTDWWGRQLARPPENLPFQEYVAWVWRWGR